MAARKKTSKPAPAKAKKKAEPVVEEEEDLDDLLDDEPEEEEEAEEEEVEEEESEEEEVEEEDAEEEKPAKKSRKKAEPKKTTPKKEKKTKSDDEDQKLEGLTKATIESNIITFKEGSGSDGVLKLVNNPKIGFDREKFLKAVERNQKFKDKYFSNSDPAKKYSKVSSIIKKLMEAGYKLPKAA